jgi:hypothetical protein
MRKLLQVVAVIAILCIWTNPALADDPAVSAQPNVQPGANGSTVGGSASASGGDAGPVTFASSEPITASSTNTTGSNGPSSGSTSASGPGTTATVPTTASASDPAAPDGSAPTPTTSGPFVDADASESNVSASDSRVRADAVAIATGSFAAGIAGVGFVEDPTFASTCSTAEAEPGVPTDASLGTNCGSSPSSVSEDFSASDANGNGGAGSPSGSSCLQADASAGPSPSADLSGACAAQGGTTPSTGASSGNTGMNGTPSGPASTDSRETNSREAGTVLGFELIGLPSTATEPASISLLGATLALAGLVLLQRARRKS